MTKFKEQMEIAKAKIQAAQDEAMKLVKNEFQVAAKEIFEQDSRLESFGWRQYSQYFNDGDVCNFYAYTDPSQLFINGDSADEEDEGREQNEISKSWQSEVWARKDSGYCYVPNPNYNPASEQTVEMIQVFLRAIGEDSLKAAFGDHAEITVYKDRVEVEGYTEHD